MSATQRERDWALEEEVANLKAQLADLQETVRALQSGDADALVVDSGRGPQVFTLKSAAEPYRVLVERMPEAALTVSPEGVVAYCNEAFASFLGVPIERILGANLSALIESADLTALLSGERGEGREIVLRRADGQRLNAITSSTTIDVDGQQFVSIVVMDVSRKVLRIEQEQYRTLQGFYDSAPFLMGIAELDGDTIVAVSGNRAVADFFSVSPDALSGRMGRDFGNTPEMEKLWVNHYRMAQTQGRPVSFRFSTVNDQGLRWLTATVVHIGEGKTGRPQFSFVAEDFSERKKVDDALAASEQRFRSIFDHAAVGVAEIALDGRWLRANAHLCAMLGVTEAELLQLTSPNVTHPADVQADLYQRHRLLAGEIETYTLEKRYIRKDGALIWVEQAMSLVRDSQQSRAHFISVVQNISARKAVESALRESQERLAVAIETAKLSVYEFDIPNQKLHWDDRIREIWGYGSSEDVTYEAFLAGVHPDERARVEEAEERARDPNGPGRFEMTYRVINRKTGAVHWVHDTSQILFEDGRPVRMLGITQDVTADKRAEARLAQSEARFRAAVQAVSGNVWSNNAQGEMEGEQPGWAALTGQSFEEYQGYGWSRAVHPDDAQPTIDAWQAAVEAHRTFAFEHRVRRRDGVYRRFAIRALPVLSEDGEVQEWVGVHTDVTEQRDAEAILGRDREQLERLVQERTSSLAETQQRLAHAQRMEALGQLAGGIAHDFNNVLQAVQGGARLIEKRVHDGEAVRRLAQMLSETATRGSSITRRLLTFSRRGELRLEALDAIQLLNDLREVLMHTMGAGIDVLVDVPAALPALQADKGQLETVLVNLATNSRDAMDGKGVITLAAALDTVHPHDKAALAPGRYVRLWVADTGAGMTPQVLNQATEPFFTTKGVGKGTGLGLAMARGFAEQSGGALRIESEPGVGTVVTLWFPVAHDIAAKHVAEGADADPGAIARASLLVVDDEPIVVEVLAEGLRGAGYRVTQATSGATALALLNSGEAVDLMISDLSMPDMNGVELVREAHQRRPDLPAILLTGFATEAVEFMVGGSDDEFSLLRKPVTAEQLAEQVATLLGRRTAAA